jgi:biopolymer transport protein ExbD
MTRRRRYSREEPIATINVTPLVDVFLVLLVIFMVAMPAAVARIMVALPSNAQGAQQAKNLQTITVTIDKNGNVYANNEPYNMDSLREYFVVQQKNGVSTLYIEADAQTHYGNMTNVIGLAKSVGFSKIGFSTQGKNRVE